MPLMISATVTTRWGAAVLDVKGIIMSVADRTDHQGSWAFILLIYAIGVLGATTISQAITCLLYTSPSPRD